MLQNIAPASVGRWRAAGGSFTARAFAVNFGDEQADIHYEYKVRSLPNLPLLARVKQFFRTLARRQLDIDVVFLHEAFNTSK